MHYFGKSTIWRIIPFDKNTGFSEITAEYVFLVEYGNHRYFGNMGKMDNTSILVL